MSKTVDYCYSHVSPWSYLGAERFYKIVEAAGATINFKPMNLSVIFPQSGGLPLGKRPPQRQAYRMTELKRWKAHLSVDLNYEPKHFLTNDMPAALIAITAQRSGHDVAELSLAIMRKCWVEEMDVAEDAPLIEAANQCGLDGMVLSAASRQEDTKQIYDAYTQEASDKQVFGAPTYIYQDELFWGQDRLDFVERALGRN